MAIHPALLQSALALSAVVGIAAPIAAQTPQTAQTAASEKNSNAQGTPETFTLTQASPQLSRKLAQFVPPPQSTTVDGPSPTASPVSPQQTIPADIAPRPSAPNPAVPDAATPSTTDPSTAPSAPATETPGLPVPSEPVPGGNTDTPNSTEAVPPPTVVPGTEAVPAPTTEETTPERQVLISEVKVEGAEGDLANKVYEAITTRPGQATTRSQLQVDINAIFATGYFSAVRAEPTDTPLGVRVTFVVQPNPVLRSVKPAGNQVLTQAQVDEIFQPQYGKILNLRDLQEGIKTLNKFYQDKGYVLGQVTGSPQIDPDGTVTLQVSEGVIESIDVRYKNKAGEAAKGKTRKYIVLRELRTKPGDVLNKDKLQADLKRVFGLGLFDDVQVALEPGEDPRKVVVNLNVQERRTGSLSFGGGYSSDSGLFGTAAYSLNNLGGNNQRLSAQVEVGPKILLFDASFTDPWIGWRSLSHLLQRQYFQPPDGSARLLGWQNGRQLRRSKCNHSARNRYCSY